MSAFENYFFNERMVSVQPTFFQDPLKNKQKPKNELNQEAIDSLVALINKTVSDWNREKRLDGKQILAAIEAAIKSEAIKIE